MIDFLYSIYKFVTDIPEIFDIICGLCVVGMPLGVADWLNKKYPSKIIAYAAPIVILLVVLGTFAGLYQVTGYPSWIGLAL
jgi:hypothetical protein